jgi:dihydroorotate dehydrogenase
MEESLRQPPVIDPPIINAAGTLGFAPDLKLPLPWEEFGAFVTNPISMRPRKPASGNRWMTFTGGALLHNGHPNPGFKAVLQKNETKWAQAPMPVIVHLLAGRSDEMAGAIERLETLENILAVEIGVPDTITVHEVNEIVAASVGELPLLMQVPLHRVLELGPVCFRAGATAVSLGPPRGTLPGEDYLVAGRIYGPGIYPLALQIVQQLSKMDLPVIGACGVYSHEEVDTMIAAGALAVKLDLSLWRGDWFSKIED